MLKDGKYYGWIYKIINLVNNKIYIGQTRNYIYDRWAGHKHDALKRNCKTAIGKAIRKYGEENFKIEKIKEIIADSEESLNTKLDENEIYYIDYYKSLTHQNGYNITIGGDNIASCNKVKTYCFTKEGELIGEFESRYDAGRFIGVRGEDISASILRKGLCRGYYFSSFPIFDYIDPYPNIKKKVIQYDLDGNIINTFENYKVAAREFGDSSNIYSVCIGKTRSYKNYIFRFEYDAFDLFPLPCNGRCVNLYKNNEYIQQFDSIKKCANYIGAFPSNVSGVLNPNSPQKTIKGYVIYYADDPNQPDKTKIIA